MAQEQKIFRVTDKQIVEAFVKICKEIEATNVKLVCTPFGNGSPAITVPSLAEIEANEALRKILECNSVILLSLNMTISGPIHFVLNVTRGEHYDTLALKFNDPNSDPSDKLLNASAVINQHLNPYKPTPIPEAAIGQELADFYRSRDEVVHRLEHLNLEIIKQNEEYRRRLEEQFNERKTELEGTIDSRRTQLQAEYDAENAKLNEQRKALDDRSARHARRDQFRQSKTLIQNRNKDFGLSKVTTSKRWSTHVLFFVLISFLGVLASLLGYQQIWRGLQDPYYGFRFPLAVLAFVGAVIYYIRWNDEWFRRHADEEFKLRRYDLDMDRAAWLVELAMEGYESGEDSVQEALLPHLSSGLFGKVEETTPTQHPAEDIRNALIDAAGQVEVTVPGFGKLLFNRRQLKKIRSEIDRGRIKVLDSEAPG